MREGGGACKLAFDLPVNPIVGLSVCLFSGHHVDEEMLLLLQPTYGMTMTGAEGGREGGTVSLTPIEIVIQVGGKYTSLEIRRKNERESERTG